MRRWSAWVIPSPLSRTAMRRSSRTASTWISISAVPGENLIAFSTVEEHLAQPLAVAGHVGEPGLGPQPDRDVLVASRLDHVDYALREVDRVDAPRPEAQAARVEVAREQDVVDDVREAVGFLGDDGQQAATILG